jgi:hypothetical protein
VPFVALARQRVEYCCTRSGSARRRSQFLPRTGRRAKHTRANEPFLARRATLVRIQGHQSGNRDTGFGDDDFAAPLHLAQVFAQLGLDLGDICGVPHVTIMVICIVPFNSAMEPRDGIGRVRPG